MQAETGRHADLWYNSDPVSPRVRFIVSNLYLLALVVPGLPERDSGCLQPKPLQKPWRVFTRS